jgi:hypothetical protein
LETQAKRRLEAALVQEEGKAGEQDSNSDHGRSLQTAHRVDTDTPEPLGDFSSRLCSRDTPGFDAKFMLDDHSLAAAGATGPPVRNG